jgi:hypothetical protein
MVVVLLRFHRDYKPILLRLEIVSRFLNRRNGNSAPYSSSPGLTGRSSIPEAGVIEPRGRGVLDHPHARVMTVSMRCLYFHAQTWLHSLATQFARGFAGTLPSKNTEGTGKTGCALHPRSRVQYAQRNAHTSIQVQRRASGLPCAVVLRLIARSPRRPAFLPPSPRGYLREA